MRAERPTANRKVNTARPKGGSGVSFGGALGISVLCSAAAYFAGDKVGYARGSGEVAACSSQDVLAQLDAEAQLHRQRTRAAAAEKAARAAALAAAQKPAAPEPLHYSFHNTLRGAPQKPAQSDLPPPPAPPAVHALPKVEKPAEKKEPVAEKPVEKPATERPLEKTETAQAPAPVEPVKPVPGTRELPAANDYALQVGAFPDKTDALKVFDKLKSAGLKPAIVPSESPTGTWYRIRVGRYADRATAENGARHLQAQTQLAAVVVKH
ncbi:MAG: SPOR domain-containing protein [Myxococcota bacterium]